MTTETTGTDPQALQDAPAASGGTPTLRAAVELLRSADRFRLVLAGILLAQAAWLAVLMSRGWYYQADLANLAAATGKPLSWGYLSAPQGGHFGAPSRLIFWLFNRVAPLNYSGTIVPRVMGQALSTLLLARLLVLLVGRRTIVVLAVALYAFSPLLIQGTLWLSASTGLVGSQLLVLLMLVNHVHYAMSHRLLRAIGTAACALGATLMSEQAAATVLSLPILSLAFLSSGGASRRIRETMACWREWLLIGLPLLAYVVYYFTSSSGYGTAAHRLAPGDAARVVRVEFTQTVFPGLVGGPWRWFAAGDNYLGLAAPSTPTQVLCGCVVFVVVALSVRAQGWRALAAWSVPGITAGVGILVVAIGRYHAFGIVIAQQFEHAYYTAVPAAIALCIAFCGVDLGGVRARGGGTVPPPVVRRTPRRMRRRARGRRLAIGAIVGAVLAGSIISGVTYTQLWARSPAHDYVRTLERSLHGPKQVALYDTPVPTSIIPLEAVHYVSDVVGLTGVRADFGYSAPRPRIVDKTGKVVDAGFYVQTAVDLRGPQFCRFPVQNVVTVTRSFQQPERANDWHLALSYFEQHASVVTVTIIDSDGKPHLPVSGARNVLHQGPGGIHLLFRGVAAVAVRVQSTSPATNVCITAAQLGFPYAVKKAGS